MKRQITLCAVLALLLLGYSVPQVTGRDMGIRRTGTGYFYQFHRPEVISVHTTATLTTETIHHFYLRQNGTIEEYRLDDVPATMVKAVKARVFRGVDNIFVKRHEITLCRRDKVTSMNEWNRILAGVEQMLADIAAQENKAPLTKIEPEARDAVCKSNPSSSKPSTVPQAKQVTYSLICVPNPDVLVVRLSEPLLPKDRYESYDGGPSGHVNSPYEVRTTLGSALKEVKGVVEFSIRGDEVQITKGAAHYWADILPGIVKTLKANVDFRIAEAPSAVQGYGTGMVSYVKARSRIGNREVYVIERRW